MNRARLRPPYPMYRVLFGLAAVPIVWGTVHLAVNRMPPAPRLYWADYVKATFVPDMSAIHIMPHFGRAASAALPKQWIYCYCPTCKGTTVYTWPPPRGLAVAEGNLPAPPVGRWLSFRATRRAFGRWLQINVYGGRAVPAILFAPLMLSLVLSAGLFGAGYTLDYRRHIAFRLGATQLRGPEMVTPRQFARKVKGNGLGIRLDGEHNENVGQ